MTVNPALPTRGTGVLELPAANYHDDNVGANVPTLSKSIAHELITNSPRHAWTQHPRLNPNFERTEEDKFDLGTVAHAALLQPDTTVVRVLDFPDWRKNDAKAARDETRAEGLIPLLTKDAARVTAMVTAAREQLAALNISPGIFENGAAEQTLVWEDDFGVVCRCRLDWLHFDLAAVDDYKSTGATANPKVWSSRTMYSIGSDLQAAFYLRGLQKTFPELRKRPAWRYVVQETFPPYALSVVEVGENVITFGMDKVERAIALWHDCLESDSWPAYPAVPVRAELPAWVETQWLERAA